MTQHPYPTSPTSCGGYASGMHHLMPAHACRSSKKPVAVPKDRAQPSQVSFCLQSRAGVRSSSARLSLGSAEPGRARRPPGPPARGSPRLGAEQRQPAPTATRHIPVQLLSGVRRGVVAATVTFATATCAGRFRKLLLFALSAHRSSSPLYQDGKCLLYPDLSLIFVALHEFCSDRPA